MSHQHNIRISKIIELLVLFIVSTKGQSDEQENTIPIHEEISSCLTENVTTQNGISVACPNTHFIVLRSIAYLKSLEEGCQLDSSNTCQVHNEDYNLRTHAFRECYLKQQCDVEIEPSFSNSSECLWYRGDVFVRLYYRCEVYLNNSYEKHTRDICNMESFWQGDMLYLHTTNFPDWTEDDDCGCEVTVEPNVELEISMTRFENSLFDAIDQCGQIFYIQSGFRMTSICSDHYGRNYKPLDIELYPNIYFKFKNSQRIPFLMVVVLQVHREQNITVSCRRDYHWPPPLVDYEDNCQSTPCLNGGVCSDKIDGYSCTCPAGYFGHDCERNVCTHVQCLNGGQCEASGNVASNADGDLFTCSCPPGFTGTYCQDDIDDCSGVLCRRHGHCVDRVNDFVCVCDAGYTGARCGVNIDECEGVVCENNGRCRDGVDSFTCLCADGFTGTHCEVDMDECASNPCGTHGECIDLAGEYSCACHVGFTGQSCEDDIDHCADGPCVNGQCVDGLLSYTCFCQTGYTGVTCSEDIDECDGVICENGGTCVNGLAERHCQCATGYFGEYCQDNFCAHVECQNNGLCQLRDTADGYVCLCEKGYTGKYCQDNIDDCARVRCHGHGRCEDQLSGFRCICDEGYTGIRCGVNIDECAGVSCQNGGRCRDGVGEFTCRCAEGFAGTYCEVDIDECASNPCGTHGECIDLAGEYSCACHVGFTGQSCEDNVDDCAGEPCIHGECVDGVDAYTCFCQPGYSGHTCEDDVDECEGVVCRHGGTCVDQINAYQCRCAAGYFGHFCEDNFCAHVICQNGGVCELRNNARGYKCVCEEGFSGIYCQDDVDDCAAVSCRHGHCVDLVNDFLCVCDEGYTGGGCQVNIDDCADVECQNSGQCQDGVSGYTCLCAAGYTGRLCEEELDECDGLLCQNEGTCVDEVQGFYCQCVPGYFGRFCQDTFCARVTCLNGGRCEPADNAEGYVCVCEDDYTGTYCQDKIDDCAGIRCHGNGRCEDAVNDFVCVCDEGFTGPRCGINIDECAGVICANNGRCQDGVNGFTCACATGFSGILCQDEINECLSGPCGSHGECNDHEARFSCSCHAGFTGLLCQENINECESNPCMNGECVDGIHSYTCFCEPGFHGPNCEENTNECGGGEQCRNGGTCVDGDNSFTCHCATGYFGQFCEDNFCAHVTCQNSGTCNLHDNAAGYVCSCEEGFTGTYCQENIDDCAGVECSGNGHCIDHVSGFLCVCDEGFTGNRCETNIDDCADVLCEHGAVCRDGISMYTCLCADGYAGTQCEVEIDECASNPCGPRGECIDSVAEYACTCEAGFTGQFCQENINECEDEPCVHGDCIDRIDSFLCVCEPGYSGQSCNVDIDNCGESGRCENGGHCVDEVNGFICRCLPGYFGQFCEDNFCAHVTCQNNGTCNLHNNTAGYVCSCEEGFIGTYCQDNIDDCMGVFCGNGHCVDRVQGFDCVCSEGYTGDRCQENIDDCAGVRCSGNGHCEDHVSGFVCVCDEGFTGNRCGINIDDCAGVLCDHGGQCRDDVSTYACLCVDGYTGTHCEVDIDECASNPCGPRGECTNAVAGYTCTCAAGFTGQSCQVNIDECEDEPCVHGDCIDRVASYFCICEPGYSGQTCNVDINECGDSGPCENGGLCVDEVNGFTCRCPPGYFGQFCEGNFCDHVTCQNGGSCSLQDNRKGYDCVCEEGFTGDYCQDNIDDCAGVSCGHGHCVDLTNNFRCECDEGYSGNQCLDNVDNCASIVCRNGGTCRDGVNDFTCQCVAGFTGRFCDDDINECVGIECQNGGSCVDDVDAFYCACAPGYFGRFCEENLCTRVTCQNGAQCQLADNAVGYVCACAEGFSGTYCEDDVDNCVGVDCGRGRCEDRVNDHVCVCDDNYAGDNCQDYVRCEVAEPMQCGGVDAGLNENLCEQLGCCYIETAETGRYSCFYPEGHQCYQLGCEHGAVCALRNLETFYCHCVGNYSGYRCENECHESDFHMCESEQGACVSRSLVCDNYADCEDGSDERGCETTCDVFCNGACLEESWICDGEDDCGDFADERNCAETCETNGHFLCGSGLCIAGYKRCDGELHCPQGEDEDNCAFCTGFQCDEGCIPASRRCDDTLDCINGADEFRCDFSGCGDCEEDRLIDCLPVDGQPFCICSLGSDPTNGCHYKCNITEQFVRVHSPGQAPYCGDSPALFSVTSVDECKQRLCDSGGNVISLRTEESVCSVQDCEWDLDLQTADFPNQIYVLLPDGYNPCSAVDCGAGECVLRHLASPQNVNYPRLNYEPWCLCAGESLADVITGCPYENVCSSDLCGFGGTCRQDDDTYICQCPDDRIGRNCEFAVEQVPYGFDVSFILEQEFIEAYTDSRSREYSNLLGDLTSDVNEKVFGMMRANDKPTVKSMAFSRSSAKVKVNIELAFAIPVTKAVLENNFRESFALVNPEIQILIEGAVEIFACDFEESSDPSCPYKNLPGKFEWTRRMGETPTPATGPFLAAVNDWYLYIEASYPREAGDNARFKTQTVNVYGQGCLSFYLSMYGRDIAYLKIYQYTYNRHFRRYSKRLVYNEGDYSIDAIRELEDVSSFWEKREIAVDLGTGENVYFEFEGSVWTGSKGDMAIDYLTLHLDSDKCREPCYDAQGLLGSEEPVTCCLSDYDEDNVHSCTAYLFYRAHCVQEGDGNPMTNETAREYYASMTLYSVWNIVQGLYAASLSGDPTATRLCFGKFQDVRLMDDSEETTHLGYGRVEVKLNGEWSTICDDGFSDLSAKVICTHLGLSAGEMRSDAFYGVGSGDIFFTSIQCTGSESHLYECTVTRNLEQLCTHSEDVGIICSIENAANISYIGADPENVGNYRTEDDTRQAVFIPNIDEQIRRDGNLTQWNAAFISDAPLVYFQVWREIGENFFKLVGQTKVKDIVRRDTTTILTFDLDVSDYIVVKRGDLLGFYFPQNNPLPHLTKVCYKSDEQLRYIKNPAFEDPPVIGKIERFEEAPLAWEPCRSYMLRCKIENEPFDSSDGEDGSAQVPIPAAPAGALFFESFEDEPTIQKRSLPGLAWLRKEGSTESLGTGPRAAIRGSYYLYAEASDTNTGDQFVYETGEIDLAGTLCVSFLYHMFGPGVGRLKVVMVDKTGNGFADQALLNLNGSQSENWLWFKEKVPFKFSKGSLRFVVTMAGHFQGDVAIDNVLVIPGTCPFEYLAIPGNKTEGDEPRVQYPPPVPEMSISYVSVTKGDANSVNCTKEEPCKDAFQALNIAAKNKTIVFDDESEATYVLDLDNSQIQMKYLTLRPWIVRSGAASSIQIQLHGSIRCFTELSISNLRITGNLQFDCVNSRSISITLNTVRLEMEESFSIVNGNNVFMSLENTVVFDCLLSYEARLSSSVHIRNSTFEAELPVLDESTALTSHVPRSKNATGLLARFPNGENTHVLKIEQSQFYGLYQHHGNDNPLGAISVIETREVSVVKLSVLDSVFDKNERALDFSIKGDVDVLIVNSRFDNSFANGSGGAIRVTATLERGLGSLNKVKKYRMNVRNCIFSGNIAQTSGLYDVNDIYYQTRSPGSGGAIFVSIVVPSQLPKDGLISINNTQFHNNSAEVQGGTVFVNPEISTEIINSNFSNTRTDFRPKFGDILSASCNMTITDTDLYVITTDGTTPILSYQAADSANYRLLVRHLYFECPQGHTIEELNTTSFSKSGGLETFQLYCRGCQSDEYSLNISRAIVTDQEATINNSINCIQCPYGAECDRGILNTNGFWGSQRVLHDRVEMYQCPEEYCVKNEQVRVQYDSCAVHRGGTLCGRCDDGYSESLFGTACVPNEDCGTQNWWVAAFLAVYGVLYVFFFMFEGDWERFLSWVSKKVKRCIRKGVKPQPEVDTIERIKGQSKEKKDSEEENETADNADMGKSGYFQIFMYFIQTAALLKVKIVMTEDEIFKEVYRPQDVLPPFLVDGFEKLFSFNIDFLEGRTCLFENLTVVSKTWMKLIFVGCLFSFVISLYVFSFGCCVFLPVAKRPQLGPISNTIRVLITVLSLFLYTYQSVAEDAFLLLNCVTVDGDRVLFYDGTVHCLQEWQYAVIALVTVFVIPFFTILLFGPKLLKKKRIGVIFFMLSCIFPLFMSVPICVLYVREVAKERRLDSTNSNQTGLTNRDGAATYSRRYDNDAANDVNYCCGDVREIRDEVVDLLSGPYRTDIFKGICYEGVLNFRRMIMVVLFTFITDILLKQMALAFTCFVILLIHIKAKPFRQVYSNYVESIALSLLLIMSGTNLVKAAFYHSQIVPRGTNYLIVVVYEWIEAVCLGMLPVAIVVFLIIAMVVKKGSNVVSGSANGTTSRRTPTRHTDFTMNSETGSNNESETSDDAHAPPENDALPEPNDDVTSQEDRSSGQSEANNSSSARRSRQSSTENDELNDITRARRYPAFENASDTLSSNSAQSLQRPRGPYHLNIQI